ncbi:MAG: hypothetical protein A2020_16435 [Lentisphaerae bacterium GWF2_45_14]|nr:MAG: hypothetical protein A2020_16435 [Lentisphaerae bacterium GWF2_45_14]
MPLVYKMLFQPAPRWVIYESDDKAEDVNRATFDPILQSIPEIKRMLNRLSATKRSYALENGSITDFSGAGADITSKPKQDGVADELDRWGTFETAMQNLRNFKKRFRTFWRKKKGCLVICSSPKTEGGRQSPVWTVFSDETNRSYWTLRCKSCGNLTMRSCDTKHLQWNLDTGGNIIPDSLRLICPVCKHEHTEVDAQYLTDNGAYIAENPAQKTYLGFQLGALGVPRVFSWLSIAEAQLKAGATSDVKAQSDYDNSWRGVPLVVRKNDVKLTEALESHIVPSPEDSKIVHRLISCDTQDASIYWVVRGLDVNWNSYLLACGKCVTWEELAAVWESKYAGAQCTCGIIDHGGHRAKEVAAFVYNRKGFFMYKGDSKIGARWKRTDEKSKLILANPRIYQSELLYYIYSAQKTENNFWSVPENPDPEYSEHITNVRKNKDIKNGDSYENWKEVGPDHYFDCEKMWLVIKEFLTNLIKKTNKEKRKCQRKEE